MDRSNSGAAATHQRQSAEGITIIVMWVARNGTISQTLVLLVIKIDIEGVGTKINSYNPISLKPDR